MIRVQHYLASIFFILIIVCSSSSITLHLTEEADWPPFTPEKYGKVEEGLSYALMDAIFSKLQVNFDLELYPQKRMLQMLREGTKDAATVISINTERSAYIAFSKPIFQKKGLIYHRSDRNFQWNSYEDLKGLKIGIVRGHNYGDEFKNAVKEYNLTLVEVSTVEQNFKMILADRIDIFLAVELTAIQLLRKPMYTNKISPASKPYYTKDYHIGFSKNSKAIYLLPDVNRIIDSMKKDGTLQDIIAPFLQ